ncbi:unnamed protein product [Pleuronectes platessa]|uniref:Ring finger protein 207 n=1 Tax=Pleuronectes platessa TaxID=8262 RepID=A0A9N7YD60_PLEPL|nr:unnamed protein product [Pleuronectes platessa]
MRLERLWAAVFQAADVTASARAKTLIGVTGGRTGAGWQRVTSVKQQNERNTCYRQVASTLEREGARGCHRLQSPLSMSCRSPSLSEMPLGSVLGRRPTSHRNICTKVLLAEGRETPFTEHCRNYENTYRTLQTEIQNLKDQVQELHRDLTKHHSIINTEIMGEVLDRSLHIDSQITAQYSTVETVRVVFEEIWEETFQRVTNEQEIYEAQLLDLMQLKQENFSLTTIAKQISPYILSIAKVKERLEPSFQEPKEQRDDRTETMLKIYEDGSITKDVQDSDNQTCVTDQDRDKNHRPLVLESGDCSVKADHPGRPRGGGAHGDVQPQ